MRTIQDILGKCKGFTIENKAITDVNKHLVSGDTPLHCYCQWGDDIEAVKILLDNGADPNILGEDGMTPIFSAIRGCNPYIVEILIKAGANLKHKDKLFGRNPLETAEFRLECEKSHERHNLERIVELLKKK